MRKFIYAFSMLLIGALTYAQSAEQLLDKVSNNYENQGSFYIKFKSSLENKKTKTKGSYTGEVYVKGDKYNLTIPQMDIRQIYDGRKLYTISNDNQEVTITKPEKGSEELLTPTRIFTIYKKGFNLSLEKRKGNIQYIKLIPQRKSDLKYIIVGIDKNKNRLVTLTQVNNKNTITTFDVVKQIDNISIPSTLLNFSKNTYKGYYISEI